jgi:hypothetical protein
MARLQEVTVAPPPADPPEKGVLIPPPQRAGLRPRGPRPAGVGGAGGGQPRQPANTKCDRCGAEFAWDRADKPGSPAPEWSARLVKGSEKCDCGYGQRMRGRPGPHP